MQKPGKLSKHSMEIFNFQHYKFHARLSRGLSTKCTGVNSPVGNISHLSVRRITENHTFTKNHRKPLRKSYL